MKNLLIALLLAILLLNCEKPIETIVSEPETVLDYFPMEIGNFWVYEHFRIDIYGNSTRLPLIDSVVIIGDTVIDEKKYYVFEGTDYFRKGKEWSIVGIYSDSANCIVNPNGKIIFSLNNFSDTLHKAVLENEHEPYAAIIYQMNSPEKEIRVPAGSFKTLNYRGKFIAENGYLPSNIKNPRFLNSYYGKGVGLVSKNYFYFTGEHTFEVKLAKYKLMDK